ncbi:cytochrome-c oxidase [Paenibacillus lutrae]|uniref:Cytochrome-c oxidase n=1 Tax=Paenibacillus lutrae TaxID=2078573 RepID=A0A7X3JZY1_9BACL|nr:cytochrome-c oxidase [Paenibacillus lutrae]MVP00654.1 cytochrome-c oxidase [Paenibacillus lutrae]
MGIRFIKIASLYFVGGVILGIVMGMTDSFRYTSTHAHINLLGWVSMALFGLIYHVFPRSAIGKLATAHFWLHNIGLPLMLLGMIAFAAGNEGLGVPFMSAGGTIVVLATVIFAINMFVNLNKAQKEAR